MVRTTYIITIGGVDIKGIGAKRAERMAIFADRRGQPYMVHTSDGRCVACGGGHTARLDPLAVEAYTAELEREND